MNDTSSSVESNQQIKERRIADLSRHVISLVIHSRTERSSQCFLERISRDPSRKEFERTKYESDSLGRAPPPLFTLKDLGSFVVHTCLVEVENPQGLLIPASFGEEAKGEEEGSERRSSSKFLKPLTWVEDEREGGYTVEAATSASFFRSEKETRVSPYVIVKRRQRKEGDGGSAALKKDDDVFLSLVHNVKSFFCNFVVPKCNGGKEKWVNGGKGRKEERFAKASKLLSSSMSNYFRQDYEFFSSFDFVFVEDRESFSEVVAANFGQSCFFGYVFDVEDAESYKKAEREASEKFNGIMIEGGGGRKASQRLLSLGRNNPRDNVARKEVDERRGFVQPEEFYEIDCDAACITTNDEEEPTTEEESFTFASSSSSSSADLSNAGKGENNDDYDDDCEKATVSGKKKYAVVKDVRQEVKEAACISYQSKVQKLKDAYFKTVLLEKQKFLNAVTLPCSVKRPVVVTFYRPSFHYFAELDLRREKRRKTADGKFQFVKHLETTFESTYYPLIETVVDHLFACVLSNESSNFFGGKKVYLCFVGCAMDPSDVLEANGYAAPCNLGSASMDSSSFLSSSDNKPEGWNEASRESETALEVRLCEIIRKFATLEIEDRKARSTSLSIRSKDVEVVDCDRAYELLVSGCCDFYKNSFLPRGKENATKVLSRQRRNNGAVLTEITVCSRTERP